MFSVQFFCKKINLLSAYSTRQNCRLSQRLAGELLIRKLIGYLVERRRRTQEPVPRIEIEPSAVRDGEWSDGTAGPEANVRGAFAQDLINRIGRQRRAVHSPALVEHERGHGGDVRRSCGGPKEIGECIRLGAARHVRGQKRKEKGRIRVQTPALIGEAPHPSNTRGQRASSVAWRNS